MRHNADSTQPPVYNDWRQTIYVDTLPPNSTVASFGSGTSTTRNLVVQSVDQLASNTHVFLDLPFGYSDAQVMALIGAGNQPTQTDIDLWQKSFTGVTSGNHSVTIVSYKPDGTTGVQRIGTQQKPVLSTTTTTGSGIGDLNFDKTINASDINLLPSLVQSNGQQFNAAGDVNGDGFVDRRRHIPARPDSVGGQRRSDHLEHVQQLHPRPLHHDAHVHRERREQRLRRTPPPRPT